MFEIRYPTKFVIEPQNFTGMYSQSKTLRFKLISQGDTFKNIQESGILEEDEKRAESYKKVKHIIDEYLKNYIENCLKDMRLEGLEEYADIYFLKDRSELENKRLMELEKFMRKQVSEALTDKKKYETLFSKKLFSKELPSYVTDAKDKEIIHEFDKFTTYFSGYYKNRENLFKEQDMSGTIAHRVVSDNLRKFLDNLKNYRRYKEIELEDFELCDERLMNQGNINSLDDIFNISYYNHVLTQTGIDYYNQLLGGKAEENGEKIQGINERINLLCQKNPQIKLGQSFFSWDCHHVMY